MKLLNLDELSQEPNTITHKGISYEVPEMSVENYIETNKQADELSRNLDADDTHHMEAYIALIHRSIPAMEIEIIRALPILKIFALLSFLKNKGEPEVEVIQPAVVEEKDVTPGAAPAKKVAKKGKA